MLDFPSFPRIFPLGAILFNFLFLLVAIPIEAYVLNIRLQFDRKTSVFYGISINLLSSVIGWIIFFLIEPMLSATLKSELISYIFFNRLQTTNTQTLIIFVAFIIFFGTFIFKYFILRGLLFALREKKQNSEELSVFKGKNSRRSLRNRLQNTNLVTSILIANSLSYSAIAAILFIRSFN